MTAQHSQLLSLLESFAKEGLYPLHMPGHKRSSLLGNTLPYQLDFTEIHGMDDLHDPTGILKEGMERAAHLWGAAHSFFLVNGSTCGILAGIRAAVKPGDRVLVARNCHKSVYHALELCQLDPCYLVPDPDPAFGICGSLSPQTVQKALEEHPDSRLLVLTSPTYEGVISDLDAIVKTAHRHGIPVLVDEAHGAHLGFSPYFPEGAVAAGADLVIQSAHKTLPSLTQTALLHINGDLISPREAARQLGIFETSSPSYPLMASLDHCVQLLTENGRALFEEYERKLRLLDPIFSHLRHFRVLCHGEDRLNDHPTVWQHDPGKLVISCRGTQYSGPMLMQRLREMGFELEMCSLDYVVAMTGIYDEEDALLRFAQALLELDRSAVPCESPVNAGKLHLPEPHCTAFRAAYEEKVTVPLTKCLGQIAGEYVWAYPPGIPLLVPGEKIERETLDQLKILEQAGVNVIFNGDSPQGELLILKPL